MDEVTAIKLRQILEFAAIAPGNRARFLEAGLLTSQPDTSKLQLTADWQAAFYQLPILLKDVVRANPGEFLATANGLTYRGSTSGSRGQHYIYFAGQVWNQTRLAAGAEFLRWWKIDETVAIVNVASRLFPLRVHDTAILGEINEALIQSLLTQLDRQPSAIRGYPSRLCEVATLLSGKSIPPIVAVICTGECLFEFQKHLLEKVFAAPVINEYGCQETGISGLTCPEAGRLHLDTSRCFYEVVNGQLVTTDLLNTVMPLVRYQCGDIAQFAPEPCPCGRPQPTARVLGRQEEEIDTIEGPQRPGAISMPAFAGISHYQVIQETARTITLRVQPEVSDRPLSFEEMAAWVEETFGEVAVQVLLETPAKTDVSSQPYCDPETWIQGITQGAWTKWFQPPILPDGDLRSAAQLLSEIVAPSIISYGSKTAIVQQHLPQVLNQAVTADSTVEGMIVRILFFVSSCLSPPDADQIYTQALERLHRLMKSSPDLATAAMLDGLIATLALPINSADAGWQTLLQNALPKTSFQPDSFHIQHLLHTFEPAVQRANSVKTSVVLPALSPLLAVLIGDLETLGKRWNLDWVSHWFELLYGQTLTSHQFEFANDEFSDAWLQWRQCLIRQSADEQNRLQQLREAARSPQQQARVWIETGYHLLLQGKSLNPPEWLPQLESILQSKVVTPVAWAPILRSLAKTLIEQQQNQLAYECLLASMVPSRQAAAFEQLAHPTNQKQAVLLHLDT